MNSKSKFVVVALMIGIATLWLVLTFARGGKPLPLDKADYVGEWRSPAMELVITRDSNVHYKRRRNGSETSVNGPLQKFKGDDFSVGFLFISTTFVVSKPPHQEGDKWKMTVDGVELTRTDSGQF